MSSSHLSMWNIVCIHFNKVILDNKLNEFESSFKDVKFLWWLPNHYDTPLSDETLGIPSSIKQYKEFRKQKRYLSTDLSDVEAKHIALSTNDALKALIILGDVY